MAHTPAPGTPPRDGDARRDGLRDELRDDVRGRDARHDDVRDRDVRDRDLRDRDVRTPARHDRDDVRDAAPAKTSAAATFALVFGLSALLSFLTLILAQLALVLSIIGIVLGVAGLKMTKRRGVTGKGLAIAGLVMSGLVFLLSILGIIGVSTFLNDDAAVERLQTQVQELVDRAPQQLEQVQSGS